MGYWRRRLNCCAFGVEPIFFLSTILSVIGKPVIVIGNCHIFTFTFLVATQLQLATCIQSWADDFSFNYFVRYWLVSLSTFLVATHLFATSTFLASQDAIEVMFVTDWQSDWVSFSIDFTDVTLVSDDTYRRLYWSGPGDPDDPDESYVVRKVI